MPEHDTPHGDPELVPPRDDRFCVIVRAYNEAAGLDELHRRLSAVTHAPGAWHVICVKDGSTDGTPEVLKQITKVIVS